MRPFQSLVFSINFAWLPRYRTNQDPYQMIQALPRHVYNSRPWFEMVLSAVPFLLISIDFANNLNTEPIVALILALIQSIKPSDIPGMRGFNG